MCTTITVFVFGVIFLFKSLTSMQRDLLSISVKTGFPPAKMTALAEATKVFVGTITSLSLTFKKRRVISRAAVHELTVITYFVPMYWANLCSKDLVNGPKINLPDLRIDD